MDHIFNWNESLSEESMSEILDKIKDDVELSRLLSIIFTNRKVSEEFIMKYIKMSGSGIIKNIKFHKDLDNYNSDDEERNIVINMNTIYIYQKLSMKFISQINIKDADLYNLVKYQKLDDEFINDIKIIKPVAKKILTCQSISENTFISKYRDLIQKFDNFILLYVEYQSFTKIFMDEYLEMVRKIRSKDDFAELIKKINQIIFLRCICGELIRDPDYIFNLSEKVDWIDYSNRLFKYQDLINLLNLYPHKLSFYRLIKNNYIPEKYLSNDKVIEWWLALELYSYPNHLNRKKWWKFIKPCNITKFYKSCLISLGTNTDIGIFLNDFVDKTNWNELLRTEPLEEWFITLFSHFSKKIDNYWHLISKHQKLSESFRYKCANYLNCEN